MRAKGKRTFRQVYALEDSATGLYIKAVDGAEPTLAAFDDASHFPATEAGRLSAYTALPPGSPVELVRRDAP